MKNTDCLIEGRACLSIISFLVAITTMIGVASIGSANTSSSGSSGGGDAFPHYCVSFSGKWRSDTGELYKIEQEKCEHAIIALQNDTDVSDRIDIVLDNKEREVTSGDYTGTARHAWNSLSHGTAMVMVTRHVYEDRIESKIHTFEYVNYFLLLESVHRTVEHLDRGTIQRESTQKLYRRCHSTSEQGSLNLQSSNSPQLSGGSRVACNLLGPPAL